jgi:DNA-directed RNA polymerase specialized sigma24 family protein
VAIRQEQAALLADSIARLPEEMQEVLLGRLLDGLSHAVLAERLGRTEGATRALYVRALDRLRELYPDPDG